ncbi:hypothetical protein IE81DRAFT_328397 [Ceraceosorus guamensis]|uniref:Uncharacterized protein n=1 Tax=Ceraceosorus guamensis TaxID=1522189 RepID=A0A316WC67_9BASI|nr:hypothetical protein IE81DRAFT_328397 [Ceraceosorus guamensis]PWN45145.1 hypothetical protein IE81DRAFT_328397 [Ceraceosorus guamensis]
MNHYTLFALSAAVALLGTVSASFPYKRSAGAEVLLRRGIDRSDGSIHPNRFTFEGEYKSPDAVALAAVKMCNELQKPGIELDRHLTFVLAPSVDMAKRTIDFFCSSWNDQSNYYDESFNAGRFLGWNGPLPNVVGNIGRYTHEVQAWKAPKGKHLDDSYAIGQAWTKACAAAAKAHNGFILSMPDIKFPLNTPDKGNYDRMLLLCEVTNEEYGLDPK